MDVNNIEVQQVQVALEWYKKEAKFPDHKSESLALKSDFTFVFTRIDHKVGPWTQ